VRRLRHEPVVRHPLLVADLDVQAGDATTMAMRAVGLEVVGICRTADEVAAAATETRPSIALVDRDLPGDGFAAVDRLLEVRPQAIVVLRCEHLDDEDLLTALRTGVRGILPKGIDLQTLATSMAAALRGEAILPRATTARVVSAFQRREAIRRAVAETALTARQWEILELLAAGASTAEIAETFGVEKGTVRTHISALRLKLGVRTREDAAETMRARLRDLDPS
jgi:DNA-binding NarL/FixJ family response regulator